MDSSKEIISLFTFLMPLNPGLNLAVCERGKEGLLPCGVAELQGLLCVPSVLSHPEPSVMVWGHTHISVMVSGRLAGMAVSPLPRQSTMPLLQVHMAGQEPEDKLQSWACAESVCPAREAASIGIAKS